MLCADKDIVATDAVNSEYLHGLYAYALVLTRNHAEAEDLVQETFVRALPAMGRLRPESNIKGWLFRILRNVWFNQRRKRRNAPEVIQADLEGDSIDKIVDTGKDSFEIYASKLERGRLRAAIQDLSSGSREIIQLREFEELSYEEIAGLLHCPAGTVMSRLARARSKLRVLLSSTSTGRERSRSTRGGAA
jgi:RNA polymerase sigma-70 factor (ECF subfamily)